MATQRGQHAADHDIDERPHDEGYRHDCHHPLAPRFQHIRGQSDSLDESA